MLQYFSLSNILFPSPPPVVLSERPINTIMFYLPLHPPLYVHIDVCMHVYNIIYIFMCIFVFWYSFHIWGKTCSLWLFDSGSLNMRFSVSVHSPANNIFI
jgi:hypothetical protein